MIKQPFDFNKMAIIIGFDKMATGPAWMKTVADRPLINCLCGAMANWAFKGQIWGLALPVGAGL